MHDLRVAFRLLRRDRAFTVTAATTLAICIGAHVALFTVVNHVLLQPLRVPDSDRIVLIYNSYPKAGAGGVPLNLTSILGEEGRTGTSGRGATTLRRIMVVIQVAVALVLLMSAGLLVASFRQVLHVNAGFDQNGVLTASVNLPRTRYGSDDALRRFTDDILRALRALPGVMAAGATKATAAGPAAAARVPCLSSCSGKGWC
jgi:hypothetical protein